MANLTTEELFFKIVCKRKAHTTLMVNKYQVANWKSQFKKGTLSLRTMEKVIRKVGGVVVQQKVWQLDLRKIS